ncbi:MAG: type II toxin-antitoxin system RelE/ParE family toxin [bacterium]|nr:type II toxin-antitoxin system RelE/ParE family toxin [bacterium]
MTTKVLSEAEDELIEVINYYNEQKERLGFEFAKEVKNTIQRIIQHPEVCTELSQRTRRCRTKRFPYGVVYQIRDDTILIIAIMHLRREPNYWKSRLSNIDL